MAYGGGSQPRAEYRARRMQNGTNLFVSYAEPQPICTKSIWENGGPLRSVHSGQPNAGGLALKQLKYFFADIEISL
jgi:hypothetical protein